MHLITELRQHMARLTPIPATSHSSSPTFMHSDLEKCTRVFPRHDATRRTFESPYSGPYLVLPWREKTLQILVRGRPVNVSTDRFKPAYMLNETGRGTTTTCNPLADATPASAPYAAPPPSVAHTTRSGCHVHFPARFNSSLVREGVPQKKKTVAVNQ